MNLLLLLEMAAGGDADRVVVQAGDDSLTALALQRRAWAAAALLDETSSLAYVGTNCLALPIALFAAAAAGVPFAPLNYRLGVEQLGELLDRLGGRSSWPRRRLPMCCDREGIASSR